MANCSDVTVLADAPSLRLQGEMSRMVVRRTPPETNRRTWGHGMLWLLTGLIFFAMLVGLLLALGLDPQGSRLF